MRSVPRCALFFPDHFLPVGACGGTLACSTCHVVVDAKSFAKLDPAEEEELDMLDLAFGLTDRSVVALPAECVCVCARARFPPCDRIAHRSRLGCQIVLRKELDGIICQLPEETSDARG